ncbi:putative ganglioside galactosyltransferase [Helianthus anomalus]
MYKKLARHAYEIVGQISGRRSGNQSMVSGEELTKGDRIMFLPCGLAAGSSITVVATPNYAHKEYVPRLARIKGCDPMVLVSQFKVELHGLKYVNAMGAVKRCDGLPSKGDDDMLVDGFPRCEKWMRNDVVDSKESQTSSWFKRFIGRAQKHEMTCHFLLWKSPRKEQNAVLKKEADYFGDIVVLTFMDYYELVVLKTIAICEYAVIMIIAIRSLQAGFFTIILFTVLPLAIAGSNCECFICDDDTFTRVDTVLKELKRVPQQRSLYMGNLNLYHRPLRHGKCAVSFEEWPEAVYPPYANGPGYIIGLYVPGYNFR